MSSQVRQIAQLKHSRACFTGAADTRTEDTRGNARVRLRGEHKERKRTRAERTRHNNFPVCVRMGKTRSLFDWDRDDPVTMTGKVLTGNGIPVDRINRTC